ncbi:MAG: type II toxin-antitoxin system PemK/MazF family toxin [Acidimicrobiia bacterium]|nr:type II toxin-antitoxin system PemK/MazF family toxin [Acidimicrobiia bacterium]
MGVVERAEVWWVDLGIPFGSEPGYRRPAVVVSSNRFNRSTLATVIVATITSTLRLGDAPGNVRLDQGEGGLDKPSVVNVSQILVVDRDRLVERSGQLGRAIMGNVDSGLRLVLAL